jgi:hypothetical protein
MGGSEVRTRMPTYLLAPYSRPLRKRERERERERETAAVRHAAWRRPTQPAPSNATGPIHRSCPIHPLFTVPAPEDVEHHVGRRREAHDVARGGANARRRQRRPGVGQRAEAVQVVEEACGGRRGTRAQGRAAAGGLWT